VHVRRGQDAGSLEPFDLVRVVDADADPDLADRAQAGTLLRLPDGSDLAEPFVYHSRAHRLLVLVVPSPARHRELDARRELLNALDALESVPAYAFDFRVVVDAAGLRAVLTKRLSGPPPLIQDVYDDELDELPAGPALSDELLSHLATDLVDDAEAASLEEVQDLDSDPSVEELDDDLEDTQPSPESSEDTQLGSESSEDTQLGSESSEDTQPDRESSEDTQLGSESSEDTQPDRESSEDTQPDPEDTQPAASDERRPPSADASYEDVPEGAVEFMEDAEGVEDDPEEDRGDADEAEDVQEAEEVEEIQDVFDVEELFDEEPLADPQPGPLVQSFLADGPDYALVDADWVTAYQDDDDEEDAVTLDESDLVPVAESYSTVAELPLALPSNVAVPRDFATDPRRLRAGLFGGRVWLFAKTRAGVFEGNNVDAAVQYASVGGRSVVLVALADLSADRTEAVRLAADLASPAPRTLLGALARDFVMSVALFHDGPDPVRCLELRSPREDNVARLLARPTSPSMGAVDAATAIARALEAPPPLDSTEHPFQVRRVGGSATEIRSEVRGVARWLEPSRRDRVRQGLGVPEPVIQRVSEAVLADALKVGIALPPALMQWAVSRGLAASPAEIVEQQLASFLAQTSEPDRGGLTDADVASNWNALRGAAAAFGVPIPPAVDEVLRAMDADDLARDPSALEGLNVAALLELTRHANHRSVSSIELLRRDASLHAEAVGMALRDMRRDEVVALVPALKRAGEAVVPALLATLAAKKTFVRQAAALTLAALQADEAVPGLLHLVGTETTTLWEEFARSLAGFGEVALATVVDAIHEGSVPRERGALVLAYLAKGGFASGVEELARHPDPVVAAVAASVPARLPTVERHLREFYDATATPTGPREFGTKLFRALHPETVG
jgi:hypothetical protein